MDSSSIVLYVISLVLLFISFIKDKEKTKKAIKKGWLSFIKILPILLPLFLIVGVMLTIISPDMISTILGDRSGALGVIVGLLVGAVAFLPSFVTFPLGAELIEKGAGYPQVAAFVTTLMGVGLVYWTAETKFFGTKTTFMRNSLTFISSIIVAIVIWVVM